MEVLLTIDVEAHRNRQEISDGPQDGLGNILEIFRHAAQKATFFVDLCEIPTWTLDFMSSICQRLLRDRHDVQLHAHPHHVSGDLKRWLLSEYSRQEQNEILGYAIEQYKREVGSIPRAFRAGGFGINDDTIDLLREHGIVFDSSYLYRHDHCEITPTEIDRPSKYRELVEIPVTPVVTLGTRRYPIRVAPLDFNWLPLKILQTSLMRLREQSLPYAVMLMHSSSLFRRTGRSKLQYRADNEEKLRRLLDFLDHEGFGTSTFNLIDPVSSVRSPAARPAVVINNPLNQYAILLYQSEIGKGISTRIRVFRMTHVLAVVGSVIGICWCFLYPWLFGGDH